MSDLVTDRFVTKNLVFKEESGERFFEGILSVEMLDRQGEVTVVDSLYKCLPIWMDRGGAISDTHSNRIVGKGINYAKTSLTDETGNQLPAIKIIGKIFNHTKLDDEIWQKIKSGEYKGLSFGGATTSDAIPIQQSDGSIAYHLKDIEMYEVAVCEEPAVPFALITEFNPIAKADAYKVKEEDTDVLIKCEEKGCYVSRKNKACWDGYGQVGMKEQDGKQVPNCVKKEEEVEKAEYQGEQVTLNKPMRDSDGDKKFKVYVKDPSTGNVKIVRFGDPNMEIRRDDDEARNSFRARHKCDQQKDITSAAYWSCKMWEKGTSVTEYTSKESELDRGIKVEMEHTDDPKIAEQIARDHLNEDEHYYTKLEQVHLDKSEITKPLPTKWGKVEFETCEQRARNDDDVRDPAGYCGSIQNRVDNKAEEENKEMFDGRVGVNPIDDKDLKEISIAKECGCKNKESNPGLNDGARGLGAGNTAQQGSNETAQITEEKKERNEVKPESLGDPSKLKKPGNVMTDSAPSMKNEIYINPEKIKFDNNMAIEDMKEEEKVEQAPKEEEKTSHEEEQKAENEDGSEKEEAMKSLATSMKSISDSIKTVSETVKSLDARVKALETPTDLPLKPKVSDNDDIGADVKVPDTYQSNSVQAGLHDDQSGEKKPESDSGNLSMQEKSLGTDYTFTSETPRPSANITKAGGQTSAVNPVLKAARSRGHQYMDTLAREILSGKFGNEEEVYY